MDRKAFRNGMIFGLVGALLTLIGDFLLSSVTTITTGSALVDMVVDSLDNSDFRMVMAGMLGVIGLPLEGIAYYQLSTIFKEDKGFWHKFYLWSTLAYIALAGCGVHLACSVGGLLYKWIEPTSTELALTVTEKYVSYFLMPPTVVFGTLLFISLVYQTVAIAMKKTVYPRKAAFYHMGIGVAVATMISLIMGNTAVGNAIGTGAISFGHLYMFGMFLLTLPKENKEEKKDLQNKESVIESMERK